MTESQPLPSFAAFLKARTAVGGMDLGALRQSFVPLLHRVISCHARGKVAPLSGLSALAMQAEAIEFPIEAERPPRLVPSAIARLDPSSERPLWRAHGSTAVFQSGDPVGLLEHQAPAIREPVYLPGYLCWEHLVGHHDALSDVFSLGMILASLALGLDLTEKVPLERFVAARDNLFELAPDLSPRIAPLILSMTELHRSLRATDLEAIAERLMREYPPPIDLKTQLMQPTTGDPSLMARILGLLRDRLEQAHEASETEAAQSEASQSTNSEHAGLLRDYEKLLARLPDNRPFAQILGAPTQDALHTETLRRPLKNEMRLLPSDPCQNQAIQDALGHESWVIQAPPGSGSSQVIVNLIAEFVAAGKRVLMLSEHTAALKSVQKHLEALQLASISAFVPNTEGDPKAFREDLKASYARLMAPTDPNLGSRHATLLEQLNTAQAELRFYNRRLCTPVDGEASLRDLIQGTVDNKLDAPELTEAELSRMPSWAEWLAAEGPRETLSQMRRDFGLVQPWPVLPIAKLDFRIREAEDPIRELTRRKTAMERALMFLDKEGQLDSERTLAEQYRLAHLALRLSPLALRGRLGLLDPKSQESEALTAELAAFSNAERELEALKAKHPYWREALPIEEAREALKAFEARGLLGFLSPGLHHIKSRLNALYDFARDPDPPRYEALLRHQLLVFEREVALRAQQLDLNTRTGLEGHPRTLPEQLDRVRQAASELQSHLGDEVLSAKQIMLWANMDAPFNKLYAALLGLIQGPESWTPRAIRQFFDQSLMQPHNFKTVLQLMAVFLKMPPSVAALLLSKSEPSLALTKAVLVAAVKRQLAASPELLAITPEDREASQSQLRLHDGPWLELNALRLRERVRERLMEAISPDDNARQAFEAELDATPNAASIAALVTGPAKALIARLKPVWLMGPGSLAEIWPIDDAPSFDLLIVDKAHQILLERGVPALFRAQQVILFGDDMQLPPQGLVQSEAPGRFDAEYQQDSLFAHALERLPLNRLAWRHKSQPEAIHAFLNAFFYEGRQLRVPDPRSEAAADRGMVFSYLVDGSDADGANLREAECISEAIAARLSQEPDLRIGVVCLTEGQPAAIQAALQVRAGPVLGPQLWMETLSGLQAHEADLVFLSVGYAPKAKPRDLAPFAPPLAPGAERRLNAALGCATRELHVVSSIRSEAITATHTLPAFCLKQLLDYAEAVSLGELARAQTILKELWLPHPGDTPPAPPRDPILQEIARGLGENGYATAFDYGFSAFKLPLVVRKKGEAAFFAALWVDSGLECADGDLWATELSYPALLKARGWTLIPVLSTSWFENRRHCFRALVKALEQAAKAAS